jgi:hypothetical protein
LIGFGFAWLIGPGIFRGNCPLGSFKGRYIGKKKLSPSEKEKKLNGGVAILLKKSLLVNLITFLAYYSTRGSEEHP